MRYGQRQITNDILVLRNTFITQKKRAESYRRGTRDVLSFDQFSNKNFINIFNEEKLQELKFIDPEILQRYQKLNSLFNTPS